ncbi:MAG: hypothetical protein LWX07_08900, partial [Bacteroidetes bacterium]|nr:hypothetical protein [Bacteroidota bacterium]
RKKSSIFNLQTSISKLVILSSSAAKATHRHGDPSAPPKGDIPVNTDIPIFMGTCLSIKYSYL